MIQRIFQIIGFSLVFSSCVSIRTSNRIERAFLTNYKKEISNGKTPKSYSVSDVNFDVKSISSGSRHHIRSIDVTLIDTVTGEKIPIDNFKKIAKLTKGNKEAQQYIDKFKRQKASQKIHRYGSYALMVGGIAILSSSFNGDNQQTKAQKKQGNIGAYLFLGGFLDWVGGSFTRVLNRRATTMKAAYAYQFGKPPKRWTSLK